MRIGGGAERDARPEAPGVGNASVQQKSGCEEGDLLRRARAGDEEALRVLLDGHRQRALARIRGRLHPGLRAKIDPEDILQEAHLVVARRIGEFEGSSLGVFVGWLHRIVDFKVREAMRRYLDASGRDVRCERGRGARPNTSRFAGAEPSPSQAAMGGELAERARRAFRRLPPDYQHVLHLAQVEGTDLRQVAETLDRSYEATKKLYGRAVTRFKILLDEEGAA